MAIKGFLHLNEYSNKYGVSLSTLRRRIKAGEIVFRFEEGKYWLPDQPISKYMRQRPQAPENENARSEVSLTEMNGTLKELKSVMSEMKSAFIRALQEKEEQLLTLKNEVADLRTLNRILDEENDRLKGRTTKSWVINPNP